MPDVSQKEVGRRLYHVHREKRVEETIKKIRHGVGTDWSSFTLDDIFWVICCNVPGTSLIRRYGITYLSAV
jgi:hypothetical protein